MDANERELGTTELTARCRRPFSRRCLARGAPIQTSVLEIQNNSDRKSSDAKIIEHLAALMVGDPIDCLCFDDELLLNNKIRNVLAHRLAFIQHSMSLLLSVRDSA